ncbi:MAG: molybdopterin-dependent oxidoreductase [Trueperaceae bacterium]|nr:molybdopterin-dependent oxidoreductase [Trueperaceae bacterium]
MPERDSDPRSPTIGRALLDALRGRPRHVISDAGPTYAGRDGHRTRFPGPSQIGLDSHPPSSEWDDWREGRSHDGKSVGRRYALVPTICFNCESACGLLAYVDHETDTVRKLEGNPLHPGSRGRNCAKGPATHNQITDPDRILYPLKRDGARGEGAWKRVSWDEALDDIAARIRADIDASGGRHVAYHVGRPGEDGFTNRVLQAWGIDGHNSHTNLCSSGARAGYAFWMGIDRPSPDFAEADFILLLSSHLETGHYFNPHAQRIVEAQARGAQVATFDPRLSNTASRSDIWLPSYPGSEAAVLLAVAHHLISSGQWDRAFVRRWWNWEAYLQNLRPDLEPTFASFEQALQELYQAYTFAYAAEESGIPQDRIEALAEGIARAGSRFSSYNWRSAGAGNEGGWQVSRCLMLLHGLTGSIGTRGGFWPNTWTKHVPPPPRPAPGPGWWQDLHMPEEYPLAFFEMSFLLPHLLEDGRGHLDVYFTRVYNPVWTNPDGFSWIRALSDETKIGRHVALTPTWNESAWYADYVLPMGHGSERHDVQSQETGRAQWIGFRQPVMRAHYERTGRPFRDTRDVNPGEVWEENEFWIELSWRIDPDGSLGIRSYFEKPDAPGEKMTVDDYYGHLFDKGVPGLPDAAEREGLSPLQYMRRYGAFEVTADPSARYLEEVPEAELREREVSPEGVVYARRDAGGYGPKAAPLADGRQAVGVTIEGRTLRGWPTPSGKLEFYSPTLDAWGWPEYAVPTYMKSHVHPSNLREGEVALLPNFRLPVQIHTRSANAKWLNEIAHTNPLWIHPRYAAHLGVQTGDLLRVTTRIGRFVLPAWVTEAIRPDIVACSHHFGRWRLDDAAGGNRQQSALVDLKRDGETWTLTRKQGAKPFASSDPDTSRIWWSDVGVHQNITFEVHPDPVSGMHCWHQAVRVERAQPGDRNGDVHADTEAAHASYREWLAKTRSARAYSPDRTRRPRWLPRPLHPTGEAYALPDDAPPAEAVASHD